MHEGSEGVYGLEMGHRKLTVAAGVGSGVVWGVVSLGGCTAPELRADFASVDPSERSRAVAELAKRVEEGGAGGAGAFDEAVSTRELIEELDSTDPAVRMLTIGALERITGTRRGYDWAASDVDRDAGVERWVAWWEETYGEE